MLIDEKPRGLIVTDDEAIDAASLEKLGFMVIKHHPGRKVDIIFLRQDNKKENE